MPNNSEEPTTHGKDSDFSNTKNTGTATERKRASGTTKAGSETPKAGPSKERAPRKRKSRPTPMLSEDHPIRLRVQHYLDGFCHAMLEGDTKTLAKMWSIPAFVVDENNARVIGNAAEVERFFSGAPAMYHERGIVDTRADIEALDVISDNLVMVLVRWPYIDESGREIGSESSTYTLKANEQGEFKMSVCTMRGETRAENERH